MSCITGPRIPSVGASLLRMSEASADSTSAGAGGGRMNDWSWNIEDWKPDRRGASFMDNNPLLIGIPSKF
jgi:hypothetical protein